MRRVKGSTLKYKCTNHYCSPTPTLSWVLSVLSLSLDCVVLPSNSWVILASFQYISITFFFFPFWDYLELGKCWQIILHVSVRSDHLWCLLSLVSRFCQVHLSFLPRNMTSGSDLCSSPLPDLPVSSFFSPFFHCCGYFCFYYCQMKQTGHCCEHATSVPRNVN